ncbi:winged-helix domain-containing protein [Shewanella glacialipiscicola]|uniref:winged-helix domain-containing protein n=1 Tax=Shewanella glacialipiscicola TaxID=614069 RepID=UPI003D7A862A
MAILSYRMMMLLDTIAKRNPDGSARDLDQIIETAGYKVSKQAIQFSLRSMIEKGVIEKMDRELRRDRVRTLYRATEYGLKCYKPV